jgi:hypothetical protein
VTCGEYLHSDQPAKEQAALRKIAEAKHLLDALTFSDSTLHNQRIRDTASALADALWRTIYFANGS